MKCSGCGSNKNLYKSNVSKNGTQYYVCRECNKKRVKKYRQTQKGKKNVRKAVYKSIKKYPEKQKARARSYYLLLKGEILKVDKCEECGIEENLFIHHNNYDDPLDITWLCKECHLLTHKNN